MGLIGLRDYGIGCFFNTGFGIRQKNSTGIGIQVVYGIRDFYFFRYGNRDSKKNLYGNRDLKCLRDTGSLFFDLQESGFKEKLQQESLFSNLNQIFHLLNKTIHTYLLLFLSFKFHELLS